MRVMPLLAAAVSGGSDLEGRLLASSACSEGVVAATQKARWLFATWSALAGVQGGDLMDDIEVEGHPRFADATGAIPPSTGPFVGFKAWAPGAPGGSLSDALLLAVRRLGSRRMNLSDSMPQSSAV